MNKRRTVAEVDGFIDLLGAACDDEHVNASLQRLLALPDDRRRTFVRAWVSGLLAKGAPKQFVEAVACLVDDEVAHKAREVIHRCAR